MADRPEPTELSSGPTHHLVPSFSDLVVLVPTREDLLLLIERIPPWVSEWVGKTPREIEGQPISAIAGEIAEALAAVGEDVLADGRPIEDYCVEFTDTTGRDRAVMIAAHRVENYRLAPASRARERANESGPAVLLHLQDVSQSVHLRRRAAGVGSFHGLIGRSQAMLEVFYKIEVYGPTDAPVVVSGETGTGKELVARALHERSPRRDRPFVAVNCTALSEDLFESELFGHERGAFTGAVRSHKGRFERANAGTLFLDEIGDMPQRTQAKLLRVLEQGIFERVGGEREEHVNVRILAATNLSLEQAVAVHRFRSDLYHRLSVLRIHVPPLREREGDLPVLVEHFLEILNERYGRKGVRLTPDALRLLSEYHWPGNVRELRNVLERVYVETPGQAIGRNAFTEWVRERDYLTAGGWNLERLETQRAAAPAIITPARPDQEYRISGPGAGGQDFPQPLTRYPGSDPRSFPLALPHGALGPEGRRTMDAAYSVERPLPQKPKPLCEETIRRAFAEAHGNATQAARSLGVHKATLYRHMKALGLQREDLAGAPAAPTPTSGVTDAESSETNDHEPKP